MSKQRYTPTEEEQNALAREILEDCLKNPITEDYGQSPTLDNRHKERTLRCMVNKAGGNAGKEALVYRVSIPSAWAKQLGITKGDQDLKVTFDGKKIVIERP